MIVMMMMMLRPVSPASPRPAGETCVRQSRAQGRNCRKLNRTSAHVRLSSEEFPLSPHDPIVKGVTRYGPPFEVRLAKQRPDGLAWRYFGLAMVGLSTFLEGTVGTALQHLRIIGRSGQRVNGGQFPAMPSRI